MFVALIPTSKRVLIFSEFEVVMNNCTSQFNHAGVSRNRILIFHVIYGGYCTLSVGSIIYILILLTFYLCLFFISSLLINIIFLKNHNIFQFNFIHYWMTSIIEWHLLIIIIIYLKKRTYPKPHIYINYLCFILDCFFT